MSRSGVFFILIASCLFFVQTTESKQTKHSSAMVESQAANPQWDEREVLKKEDELRQAHLSGDASTLEQLDADDFMAIGPDGAVKDKIWVVAAYKSGNNKDEAIDNSDVKVRRYGDTAVVTMRSDIKRHLNGRDMSGAFRITRVWVRNDGIWRIAVTQSTRIAS